MIMRLSNNKELIVDTILDLGNKFEINFKEGVSYEEIKPIYDPSSVDFNKNVLRRIELINEDTNELEGIHVGFTEVENISCINNTVTVVINRESETVTELENIKYKFSILENGLKATLRGDMYSLAYLLYPEDFENIAISIPELI